MPLTKSSYAEAAPDPPRLAERPASYGTLLVSGWAVFLLHVGLAGFATYNAYDLIANGFLASFGAIVRNGAYVLGYIGTGLCLLYLVLSIQRFDRLFARLAPGPVAPAPKTSWLCSVPLLAAGGTLLVVTLMRALDPELPPKSWSFMSLILAGYLLLGGLSAEAVAKLLRRAQAAGERLGGETSGMDLRGGRALFFTVIGSAGLRLGGMIYFFSFMLETLSSLPPLGYFWIADHAYRMVYVAAGTVAFAVLARQWGRALAAWGRAAKASRPGAPAPLIGGGRPYFVAAFGVTIFLCGAADAFRFGAYFFAPMAVFLVEAYVILPWLVMRLDARRIRAATEVLAANTPAAAPSPRRSVIWGARMVVFAVLLAIFGQALTDAVLDGAAVSDWMVWRYVSIPVIWRSFLHRELFWFLCVGSLTAEAVAFEEALERLAAKTPAIPEDSAG